MVGRDRWARRIIIPQKKAGAMWHLPQFWIYEMACSGLMMTGMAICILRLWAGRGFRKLGLNATNDFHWN